MKFMMTVFLVAVGLVLGSGVAAQEKQKPTETRRAADKTVTIAAGGTATVSYDGKGFKSLELTVRNKQLRYRLSKGSEILSSGHTTGVIKVNSDGASKYKLELTNPTKSSVTTKIVAEGGGNGI